MGKREKRCEVSDPHDPSSSAECRIGSRRAGAMGMVPGDRDLHSIGKHILPAQGDMWSAEGSSSPSTVLGGGHRLERVGQPDGGTRGGETKPLQRNARGQFNPTASCCSTALTNCNTTVDLGSKLLAQSRLVVVKHKHKHEHEHESTEHDPNTKPDDRDEDDATGRYDDSRHDIHG